VSSRDGEMMTLDTAAGVPPPPAALLAQLETMKPVRTRVPARTVAGLALVLTAIPVGSVLVFGARHDLAALPVAWVVLMALGWTAGLAMTLLAATRPPRGEVLPDTAKAGRTALAAVILLVLLGLFATMDAPGVTILPEHTFAAFANTWWGCAFFGVQVTGSTLIAGGLLLRRLFPIGAKWAGAAVGAAGGAAAGLTLHFICPVGGGLHVGFAHGGCVAIGALLGLLLLPRFLRA
jgi:hypothetical protein